ncbi:MAG: aldo/keto reductase [Oscillospiraceae bacterium]|jgi:predicted aldo/keto reductase-like oxidoreductase|nr:aldo/keto reductase [Oscillospiraceae bacterium]
MQYRKFGNTGAEISVLGFGCMRLPEIRKDDKSYIDEDLAMPMLMRAYELGINYFDSAPYYCNSNSESAMGRALKSVRDKIYLSTKIPMEKYEKKGDFRKQLENSLAKMETDYVDFYHFWGINKATADKINKNDIMSEVRECREQGLLRHISFSFHDAPESVKYIIDGVPGLESILCQYNLLDRSNEAMLEYAKEKGLGTAVMGPVGGGRLSPPTGLYEKLTGKKSSATYEVALRFVMGNPNISCALSGMETVEMLEKNVKIADIAGEITAEEWARLGEAMEEVAKFRDLYCTGCKYCMPCPAGIDIPKLFEFYTHVNVYGLGEGIKGSYKWYKKNPWGEGKTFAHCVDCGSCEKKCPQKLSIRKELERVCEVLENL